MSIQTGEHDVDEVLAGMHQGLAELQRLWRQARNLLDRWQSGRTSVEDLLNRRNWDEQMDRAIPRPEAGTHQAELAALQQYERDLAGQIQEQQARIDELQRQRDQSLNNDRDHDGVDDRVEDRRDREEEAEESEQAAEDLENDHDRDGDGVDDAVEDREEQRAEADAERARREEERRASEEAEQDDRSDRDGIDPATAAAGATVAAEGLGELEDENANDLNANEP
ncbi:MAG TPA: hypothetical protein VFF46_19275, partial [Kribbella sp.]